MAGSVSVKNAKLYELFRGLKLSGNDTDALLQEIADFAEVKAKDMAGKELDIALAADEQDIDKRLAELNARKAVIKNMRTNA